MAQLGLSEFYLLITPSSHFIKKREIIVTKKKQDNLIKAVGKTFPTLASAKGWISV